MEAVSTALITQQAERQDRSPRLRLAGCLCLLVTLCICGCSPMHSRLPVAWAGYPQSEGLAYQQQDPFPDPDIGPDVDSRPLGFDRPRTEARRAAEQRIFQGLPSVPESIPPGYPRGGMSSPATVR